MRLNFKKVIHSFILLPLWPQEYQNLYGTEIILLRYTSGLSEMIGWELWSMSLKGKGKKKRDLNLGLLESRKLLTLDKFKTATWPNHQNLNLGSKKIVWQGRTIFLKAINQTLHYHSTHVFSQAVRRDLISFVSLREPNRWWTPRNMNQNYFSYIHWQRDL